MNTYTQAFQAPGTFTWVAPGGVTKLHLRGWGGGGGGGSGNSAGIGAGSGYWLCGGGGGGGSMCHEVTVDVIPGTTYEIVIPAAAAGAPYVAPNNSLIPNNGTNGSDGGSVIFKIQAGATLATFQGAMRGTGATTITSGSLNFIFAVGGGPVISKVPFYAYSSLRGDSQMFMPVGPGFGGIGMITNGNYSDTQRRGCASLQGYAGGSGGRVGGIEYAPGFFTGNGNFTTYGECGGGGGGGGGPGGVGGVGGDGDDSGLLDGWPGGAGGVGTGAGGGGGAAGTNIAWPNTGGGGAGGAGGTGSLFLEWEA